MGDQIVRFKCEHNLGPGAQKQSDVLHEMRKLEVTLIFCLNKAAK